MINSGVGQGCIMSHWFFNVDMEAVMKEVKIRLGRMGVRFLEERREGRLPDILFADDLVLCVNSEEELRAMLGRFVRVYSKNV